MPRTFDIQRDTHAAGLARTALRDVQGRFCRDDADLLLTELVTNAVRHGTGDRLQLVFDERTDGGLRCEVIDAGDGFVPDADAPAEHLDGGYGLYLVDRISEDWGVLEGSTRVWFELRAEA